MRWTEDMKARALALDAAGVSAANIARDPVIAPAGKSRSSVIGFLYRERQKTTAPSQRTAPQRKADNILKVKIAKRGGSLKRLAGRQRPRAAQSHLVRPAASSSRGLPAAPKSKDVTLFDLSPDMCRFPTGEDIGANQRFCGHPVDKSLPRPLDAYCAAHGAQCRIR